MAAKPVSMRKLRDVLRLHFTTDLSQRQIARSLQMSHRTVGKYLKRLSGTDIGWPLPEDDSQLYAFFGSGS